MRIPPPPNWLMLGAIAACLFGLAHHSAFGRDTTGFTLPGGYAGRPPTSSHWPGRCWCRWHGPRGGCMEWQCRPRPQR